MSDNLNEVIFLKKENYERNSIIKVKEKNNS